MATAATPPDSAGDPWLPYPSRLRLIAWFCVQWIVIPIELAVRLVWMIIVFFGDGGGELVWRLADPLSRFLSPEKLALRMSRDPSRHEAYLDAEFRRLHGEIQAENFSWRTRVYHFVNLVGTPDGGYRPGVGIDPREYLGTPLSSLIRIARSHNLMVEHKVDLRRGIVLLLA